jgi:hypothetical protein
MMHNEIAHCVREPEINFWKPGTKSLVNVLSRFTYDHKLALNGADRLLVLFKTLFIISSREAFDFTSGLEECRTGSFRGS